jgi:hypothetical protein
VILATLLVELPTRPNRAPRPLPVGPPGILRDEFVGLESSVTSPSTEAPKAVRERARRRDSVEAVEPNPLVGAYPERIRWTLHGCVPHHSRSAHRSIAVAVHDGPR